MPVTVGSAELVELGTGLELVVCQSSSLLDVDVDESVTTERLPFISC
jgi:hypothetical protein